MKHIWLNNPVIPNLSYFLRAGVLMRNRLNSSRQMELMSLWCMITVICSFDLDFSGYEKYHLVAWSMGVYIAPLLRDVLPEFTTAVALNGTPMPIDNEFGIPVRTFDLTLKYAAEGLKGKFYQNVFFDEAQVEKYWVNPVNRTIEDRVEELQALKTWIYDKPVDASGFYQKAYVSEHDKIIPPKNQRNAWEKLGVPVLPLPDGHFPFFNFTSWKEICK